MIRDDSGAREKGAPSHGAKTPVAKLDHIRQWAEVEQIEDHLVIATSRMSGERSRWMESLGGYYYRVGDVV